MAAFFDDLMYCYEQQHSESVPTILFVIAVQLTQHIVSFTITYKMYFRYFFNPLFIFVLHIDYTYPASSLSAKIFFITSVIFSPTSP